MSFYISQKSLKQQSKLLVKHWPFPEFRNHKALLLLCQLYGYKNYHEYLKRTHNEMEDLRPLDENAVIDQFVQWVVELAKLGSINQIQSKNLLHIIWPAYLSGHDFLSGKLYSCQFQFYGACLDFINSSEGAIFEYRFDDRPSIKDAIEALGVPHPEVGGVRVNGEQVDFTYLLKDADSIQVYPHPYSPGKTPFKVEGDATFLLDVHLARLARYLRLAGFDCLHQIEDIGDELLAHLSCNHDYILLTRDKGLLKRGCVNYGRWIRNTDPFEQFKEVVEHYQLAKQFKPFSRCVKCNGEIRSISKSEVELHVPFDIYQEHSSFKKCTECGQLYWKGSHYDKIKQLLNAAS